MWALAAGSPAAVVAAVGFMRRGSPGDFSSLVGAFRAGLSDFGLIEGQNIPIEFRWAGGRSARLPSLTAELVARRVAVLAAVGGDASAAAAKQATSVIPIVFGIGADPVQAGLVKSLNRPGGNATGYTLLTNDLETKRFGLLRELVPGTPRAGVLFGGRAWVTVRSRQEIEDAARKSGQHLIVATVGSDAELDGALRSLIHEQVGALLVAASAYFDTQRDRIIAFAAEHKLPAIYQFREYAVAGGLISYGPRITDSYHHAGIYVGRILKGTKPADLPVLQPTKFELVINLKTANALGLVVPNSMQLLADEVIE